MIKKIVETKQDLDDEDYFTNDTSSLTTSFKSILTFSTYLSSIESKAIHAATLSNTGAWLPLPLKLAYGAELGPWIKQKTLSQVLKLLKKRVRHRL